MKKFILFIYLILISFVFSDMKIGWVNTQKILAEYDDVNKVYTETEKEKNRLELVYQAKQSKIDSLMSDYQQKQLLMSEEKVKQMENEIITLQQELQLFIQNMNSPQGELAQFFNNLMAPIEERIYNAIQKVSIEKEYDYVIDCSTGMCLYQKEEYNLTGLVQDQLKKMAIDSEE